MYRRALIALLGASLCLSISATQVVFGLILIELLVRRKNILKTRLLWPVVIYFGWVVLSTVISHLSAVGDSLSMASAVLFYFVIASSFSKEESQTLLIWFCLAAALAGLLGVLQKFSGVNYLPTETYLQVPDTMKQWPHGLVDLLAQRNERAVGPRSHPLTYAESLMPAFFFWAYWLMTKIKEPTRFQYKVGGAALGLMLVIGGVVFAEGRAVFLGVLVGSMVFGCLLGRRAFFTMTILVLVGLALSFSLSSRFRGRALSVVSSQQGTWGDQQSKSTRYRLWASALQQIAQQPLLGVGVDGGALVTIDPVDHSPRAWSETHNIFLQTAMESGLVGLGLFLWLLACIFQMSRQLAGTLKATFVACLICFVIAGFTESWTNDKEIAMLFWALVGSAESFLKGRNETA